VKTIGELIEHPDEFQEWFTHTRAAMTVLHALSSMRLLELWDAEPIALADLAAGADLPLVAMGRIVGFLASQRILELQRDGRVAHTQRSRTLRDWSPALASSRTIMQASFELVEALRQGITPFEARYGAPVFAYFDEHPNVARVFGEHMSLTTAWAEDVIIAQHSFRPFRLAVDIGGSHGTLLARLLAENPEAQGVLFDLPAVAEQAGARLDWIAEGGRIDVVGGDFFQSVPSGGDLYLLKQILHDWNDDECTAILRSVRMAIAPGGRLAVIDRLLPEENEPDPVFASDIMMMVWTTGQERKLSQFEQLFAATGFALDRVTRNYHHESVIEAVPV